MASSLISLHLLMPIAVRASSSPSTTTTTTTTTAAATTTTTESPPQTLDQRFGRKGIKFTESAGAPAVELTVRNGSSLRLRIPDGLITSYKPKVYWKDDGFFELLHTVSDGEAVRGGLGLVLDDVSRLGPDGSPWSASEWVVKDTDSDSIDAVQVELSCVNGDGSLEILYVVSLYPLSIATAVVVKNIGTKPVKLTSAMLSHLKFKSRRGSAIQGLKGCYYCDHPPPSSNFAILSSADALKPEPPGWFSFPGSPETDSKKEQWTVEEDKYTILRGKLSRVYSAPPAERLKRVYSTPPSKYDTIDQGSRLGFRVIRMGYDDIYLSSPGSLSQTYGEDYFICTGPASILVPVNLNPGEEWKAAQVIEHDNL